MNQILFAVIGVVLAAQHAALDDSDRRQNIEDELERLKGQYPELRDGELSERLDEILENAFNANDAAAIRGTPPLINDNPLGLASGERELRARDSEVRRQRFAKPTPAPKPAAGAQAEEFRKRELEQAGEDERARLAAAGGSGSGGGQTPVTTGTSGTGGTVATPPPVNVPLQTSPLPADKPLPVNPPVPPTQPSQPPGGNPPPDQKPPDQK